MSKWHKLCKFLTCIIPACLSNHMSNKVWGEITYPFSNFNLSMLELSKSMFALCCLLWVFWRYVTDYNEVALYHAMCVLVVRGDNSLSAGPVYIGDQKFHDDVIKWKHFSRYWPFVRGIHRLPVNSPHKGQWRGALMFFFDLHLNKRLSKQAWGWWLETPSRSLWRHRNVSSLCLFAVTVLIC